MARFGAFCFPATGHLNPMTALARSLEMKGHEVILFGIADTEARVRAAGIKFHRIGGEEYPIGTLGKLDERLARLKGLAALRFTLERVRDSARMVLRDGPRAVQTAGIDALLVDEADFAGNVADYLGLPWISIALVPPLIHDDRFPPFWLGWAAGTDPFRRLRNRLAIETILLMGSPIFRDVDRQRIAWGLKPNGKPQNALSTLAQITSYLKHSSFPCGVKSRLGSTIPGRSYTLSNAQRSISHGSASMDARSFTHRLEPYRTVRKPYSERLRTPAQDWTLNC